MRHQRSDMRQLSRLAPQKFLARRNVEEQIAHRDRGSDGNRRFVAREQPATGDLDPSPRRLTRRMRLEQQTRHGSDRGQRLSTETEGGDGLEVFHVAQFAGGVALEGEQRVVAHHSEAVVGDANQPAPAGLHIDADARRAGIQRVLEQLFDDAGRTLHDLARGDFVRHVVREDANAAHVN